MEGRRNVKGLARRIIIDRFSPMKYAIPDYFSSFEELICLKGVVNGSNARLQKIKLPLTR